MNHAPSCHSSVYRGLFPLFSSLGSNSANITRLMVPISLLITDLQCFSGPSKAPAHIYSWDIEANLLCPVRVFTSFGVFNL